MNSEYIAAIITIPERSKEVALVTRELARIGIPYKLYIDPEHRGAKWNQSRMFFDLCSHNFAKHIITATDDIIFKPGWFENANRVIQETDFQILSLFTNQHTSADDEALGIRSARYRMWMYDQCCFWRKGILNMKFWDDFMAYAKSDERTRKEKNYLDCMMSAFVFDNGYKCATFRPNLISLQRTKSFEGHNIVIKEN